MLFFETRVRYTTPHLICYATSMSSTPELPGIAFAMRYPDDVGLVWASMSLIHAGVIHELTGIARAVVCFPALTERPAFQTPWATRLTCDWYDTRTPASRDRIRAIVGENRIEVVLYVGCPGWSVDLYFLRGLGVRTVNWEVDSYPSSRNQPWFKWVAKQILRRWLGIGVHNSYVANAHNQRRFLLEFTRLPPHRVETVVNGVDLERFTPDPRPDPVDLGLPITDYYIVSVSQARPEKRIDVLIDAASELLRLRPGLSITFVHVGGGQCLDEWKARAARLELGERYQFPGTRADVVPYLRLATIFAHAAERESFGFVVAEAMACGKPVISARSPGPAEIIDPGVTGILVEPGDIPGMVRELLSLLDDPSRREKMGVAGRERCARLYDGRRPAVELARVIREQLGGIVKPPE
jgi:glycosyltransferase involved in cell wall biosynthesis